jgi:hypothetical protein
MIRRIAGRYRSWGARRHVAIDLCVEIQADGWSVTHGISDALANDAGRGQAGEFRRSHLRRRLVLGYESESAFSTAFKRVMGYSPRQYSRGRNPSPSQGEGKEHSPGRRYSSLLSAI